MNIEQRRAVIADAEKMMDQEMKILRLAFPDSMLPENLRNAVEEKFLKVCDSIGAPRPSSYK